MPATELIEIDPVRTARLERLAVLLREWQADPASWRWEPIRALLKQLDEK